MTSAAIEKTRKAEIIRSTFNRLSSTEEIWQGSLPTVELRYHPVLRMWVGPKAAETISSTLGSFGRMRLRRLNQRVRPFGNGASTTPTHREQCLSLRVPPDATIYSPLAGDRMVLASLGHRRVIKVFSSKALKTEPHDEIAALLEISQSPLKARIAGQLEWKVEGPGCQWMATDFVPNHNPLGMLHRFRLSRPLWRSWRTKNLGPFLRSLHERFAREPLEGSEILAQIESSFTDTSHSPIHQFLLRLAATWEYNSKAPVSRIYGDGFSQHIHGSCSDWKLIDWGKSTDGPSILDYLVDSFSMGAPCWSNSKHQELLKWLVGQKTLKTLSRDTRMNIEFAQEYHPPRDGRSLKNEELRELIGMGLAVKILRVWNSSELHYAAALSGASQ